MYIPATKVNIYAQTMAHLHGGAAMFTQPHLIDYLPRPELHMLLITCTRSSVCRLLHSVCLQ